LSPIVRKRTKASSSSKSTLSELFNDEVDDYMKKLKIKYRTNVCMIDELPKRIKKNQVGVINLDTSDGQGTHFVAYANYANQKYCMYFDSYGFPIPELVKKFLTTSKKELQYNDNEVQKWGTSSCGYFCLYWLNQMNHGKDYYDIIMSFDNPSTDRNENIIRHFADEMRQVKFANEL